MGDRHIVAGLLIASVIVFASASARAEATHFNVSAGAVGVLQVTIIALDANGMLATDYRGTVRILGDVPFLPVTYTFTNSDRGRHVLYDPRTVAPGDAARFVGVTITATDLADAKITGAGVVFLSMGPCEAGPPPIFLAVPEAACASSVGLTATVNYPAVIFTDWSITNGTITSGQGTRSITFSAGEAGVLRIAVQAQTLECAGFSTAQVLLTHCRRRSTR